MSGESQKGERIKPASRVTKLATGSNSHTHHHQQDYRSQEPHPLTKLGSFCNLLPIKLDQQSRQLSRTATTDMAVIDTHVLPFPQLIVSKQESDRLTNRRLLELSQLLKCLLDLPCEMRLVSGKLRQ